MYLFLLILVVCNLFLHLSKTTNYEKNINIYPIEHFNYSAQQ